MTSLKKVAQCLLLSATLASLPCYVARAEISSEAKISHASKLHDTLVVDVGAGITYGWIVARKDVSLSTKPIFNARAIYSYVGSEIRAGIHTLLQVGVGTGASQRVTWEVLSNKGYSQIVLEERVLNIPIIVGFTQWLPEGISEKVTAGFGCECSVAFMSKCYELTASGEPRNEGPSFEKVSDFSRFSGSILWGSQFFFPRGVSFSMFLRLPFKVFQILASSTQKRGFPDKLSHLSKDNLEMARFLYSTYSEFRIGLDILQFFQQDKPRRQHR